MPAHRLATLAALGVMMVMAACAGPVDQPADFAQPIVISPEPKTPTAAVQNPAATPPVTQAPAKTLPATATVIPSTPTAVPELPAQTPAEVEVTDGLTENQRQVLAEYPPLGAAPELRNEQWLNSEPLRLAGLRGKVVLLDMWTFG